MALRDVILEHDPDLLTGYNISFDNNFIKTRLAKYGLALQNLGRPKHSLSCFTTKVINTAALGNNELILWNIPGRIVLDLFLYSKSNFPTLPNHKLQTCGEVYIGTGKDDIVFGTILKAFADESAVDLRGEVAKYCLQVSTITIHIACSQMDCNA